MFQISVPSPVFNLKAVALLFIPESVVLRVITSVAFLFILLTVQLTISEISETSLDPEYWGRGVISSS